LSHALPQRQFGVRGWWRDHAGRNLPVRSLRHVPSHVATSWVESADVVCEVVTT